MLDTVRGSFNGSLETERTSNEWLFKRDFRTGIPYRLTHRKTKLRVMKSFIRPGTIDIEVSLPKLLFGINGTLLVSQADVDEAVRLMIAIASDVVTFDVTSMIYRRVDLVIHVPLQASMAIESHRFCRAPYMRAKLPVHHEGSGLLWSGARIKVMMYDKSLKEYGVSGSFLRVECSGKKVISLLARGAPYLTTLKFDHCYQVLRQILIQLQPDEISDEDDFIGFLCYLESEGLKTKSGHRPLDLWTSKKKVRRSQQIKRNLSTRLPRRFGVDWRTLLPEEGPPEPIHILPKHLELSDVKN